MPSPTPEPEETGAYAPETPSLPGERFAPGSLLAGRYRIVALLGKGGMGEVYRADDLTLGQSVALKFLPRHLVDDADRLARFRGEVRIARQISHPNVCRVYDIAEHDGQSFLTMEYVDGEDLAILLKKVGRLPEERGVEIARHICLGLAAAHDRDVLHRDLKPANVMLDGRGQVRVLDFGLAVAARDATDARSGTPLYQSPEQISGKEVTVRSDIYTLGLVLYELFTGRRAFPGSGRDSEPSKPSSHVSNLNPAVERVILKCLEADPANRPRSAYEVLAGLPGGDPLAAALAAGETPSPQLVADAPVEGTLHPGVAVALLAVVVGGLFLMAWLSDRYKAYRRMPLPDPAVLEEWARGHLRDLGYTNPPADTGGGFTNNTSYLKHVLQEGKWADERPHLASARPAAVRYWYRQSPHPMVAGQFVDRRGSELIDLRQDNPPLDQPGMVLVRVDTRGRLVGLMVVPNPGADPPPGPVGWDRLLHAAWLDAPGVLREVPNPTPPVTPPVYADRTAAWEGAYPERPDVPIRVEAGSYRCRPVYFHIWHPPPAWDNSAHSAWQAPRVEISTNKTAELILFVAIGGLFVTLAALAVRNVRRGRGDRRGAARMAGVIVALGLLLWLFGGGHTTFLVSLGRFMHWLSFGLTGAAIWAVAYLALEPVMRRRCPHRLTALARVLDGRWRDPLVGRDVLIGAALGVAAAAEMAAFPFVLVGPGPIVLDSPSFTSPALRLVGAITGSIYLPWVMSALFVVLSLVVRRDWVAAALLFVLFAALDLPRGSGSEWAVASTLLAAAVGVVVLVRFGVLALMAWSFVGAQTGSIPLTLDPTAWYIGASLTRMLAVGGLAAYGFVVSLGGRPLFGKGILGDE